LKDAGLDRLNVSIDTLDPERYRHTTGGEIEPVLNGIEAAIAAGFTGIKINMVIGEETSPQEVADMERYCEREELALQKISRYSLREEKRDGEDTDRPPKCAGCNRLRLTADGLIKPCLHSPVEVALIPEDPRAALIEAVDRKPLRGGIASVRSMHTIGG